MTTKTIVIKDVFWLDLLPEDVAWSQRRWERLQRIRRAAAAAGYPEYRHGAVAKLAREFRLRPELIGLAFSARVKMRSPAIRWIEKQEKENRTELVKWFRRRARLEQGDLNIYLVEP